MKVKSLQIGGVNESKTTVTYRKLGKHAYIVNEAILIVFAKGKENTHPPVLYKLSSIEKEDFKVDFLDDLKMLLKQLILLLLKRKHLNDLHSASIVFGLYSMLFTVVFKQNTSNGKQKFLRSENKISEIAGSIAILPLVDMSPTLARHILMTGVYKCTEP